MSRSEDLQLLFTYQFLYRYLELKFAFSYCKTNDNFLDNQSIFQQSIISLISLSLKNVMKQFLQTNVTVTFEFFQVMFSVVT